MKTDLAKIHRHAVTKTSALRSNGCELKIITTEDAHKDGLTCLKYLVSLQHLVRFSDCDKCVLKESSSESSTPLEPVSALLHPPNPIFVSERLDCFGSGKEEFFMPLFVFIQASWQFISFTNMHVFMVSLSWEISQKHEQPWASTVVITTDLPNSWDLPKTNVISYTYMHGWGLVYIPFWEIRERPWPRRSSVVRFTVVPRIFFYIFPENYVWKILNV